VTVQALAFDVFGTVVDWRSSIIRELEAFGRSRGLQQDWSAMADNWRSGYAPAMDRVRRGELPWTRIDDLHRMILVDLLTEAGITSISDEDIDHLNRAWHRLDPWPDSVRGLSLLKERFIITTLSNGNVSLLTNMAKRAGLPWDTVISAELFHHYKPDPEAYLGCADLLGVRPGELMLVAAHPSDLRSARDVGLGTAYVARPQEYGPGQKPHRVGDDEFDFTATDFLDLAEQLGPESSA
jgi:2-haloacid dehalogenase